MRTWRFNHREAGENNDVHLAPRAGPPDDNPSYPCSSTDGGVCFSGVRRLDLDRATGRVARVSTVAGRATWPSPPSERQSRACNGWADGNASASMFNFIHGLAFEPLHGEEGGGGGGDGGGEGGDGGGGGRDGGGGGGDGAFPDDDPARASRAAGSSFLYVCDEDNNRIRRVDLHSGETTTLAGSGAPGVADGPAARAQFRYPGGVGVGADGTVYVGDYASHRIRNVTRRRAVVVAPSSPAGGAGSPDPPNDDGAVAGPVTAALPARATRNSSSTTAALRQPVVLVALLGVAGVGAAAAAARRQRLARRARARAELAAYAGLALAGPRRAAAAARSVVGEYRDDDYDDDVDDDDSDGCGGARSSASIATTTTCTTATSTTTTATVAVAVTSR